MTYGALRERLPGWLRRHVVYFETRLNEAVAQFAAELPDGVRVLDAGAGETQHKPLFARQWYCGVDLGIGDTAWDYAQLDVVADLTSLPFRDEAFDACINIVTLEHVREPARVLQEIGRVMAADGRLLLVAPQEWEVHQAPHDYFRYTRYGLAYLLGEAGFVDIEVTPVGGFFRLLSRRLLNGLQFFPGVWMIVAAVFLAPAALVLPFFEPLDEKKDYTLGYICKARKGTLH
ncbi:MAG: methyltransferase domain-containing protein [Bryobacteraceae bacterium]